ncbi:Ig-like domain-containing protein [Caldivirga maquilingensis]|nr:Ig-like domain-containing protein [Caldivirga maquilingensis]
MFNLRKGQMSAIEAIVIVVVIVLMVIVFIRLIPSYLPTAGSEVNTLQLNALAQSLLNYIITNPGNPVYWGQNASLMNAFGLASFNSPYSLDPFKVLQLVFWDYANNASVAVSPGNIRGYCSINQINGVGFQQFLSQYGISYVTLNYLWLFTVGYPTNWVISYNQVKQLLGLGNSYDFVIVIHPLYMIRVINLTSNIAYIKVTDYSTGVAIPNATVTVQYFITSLASNNAVFYQGYSSGITNSNGVASISLPVAFNPSNYYYMVITAQTAGLKDYAYYQYPAIQIPLLTVGIVPLINSNGYSVVFADPHIFTNCLLGVSLSNPSQSALGLRVVAVYKSIYNFTTMSINFTFNPSRGSNSYPVSCTILSSSNPPNYSACYWNLPSTPMLLLVWIQRNSQGQSGSVPLSQLLVIPLGYNPDLYLVNRTIIFGYPVKYAPTGVSRALVYIGDAAYVIKLYLYYRGNAFSGLGVS